MYSSQIILIKFHASVAELYISPQKLLTTDKRVLPKVCFSCVFSPRVGGKRGCWERRRDALISMQMHPRACNCRCPLLLCWYSLSWTPLILFCSTTIVCPFCAASEPGLRVCSDEQYALQTLNCFLCNEMSNVVFFPLTFSSS